MNDYNDAGWISTTLGALAEPGDGLQTGPFGSQLHAAEYTEQGIPVVMPKDMLNGRVLDDTIARVSPGKAASLHRYKCKKGDILFGRRGDIGRCSLITDQEEGWLCGTGCLRFRPQDKISSKFLIYLLGLPDAIEWLNSNAVGQTMLNLNTSILANLPLTLPPLPEQRRIAEILSTWDRAIDLTAQLIAAKQQRKRGLMQALLTGKRRFAEFQQADDLHHVLPREWSTMAIEEVSSRVSRGKAPSYVDAESDVLAINQKCVRNGRVVVDFARPHDPAKPLPVNEFLVEGDICVNSTGTGTAGRVGLWVGAEDASKKYFVDTHITLVRPNLQKASPKYLAEVLNLEPIRRQIEAQCIHGGTNQVELSRSEFAEFQVPLPPLEEQRRIAAVLAACDREIELLQQKRDLLRQQKQGLMQQLLTGQVRVS